MNLNLSAFHSVTDERLVINDATRHQYYATMQAEVCDEDTLDAAFNRRRARALLARRDQRRLVVWFVLLSACAAAGLIWALA